MHVSVQKSTRTTWPRSSAEPSGSELGHPVAPPSEGVRRPSNTLIYRSDLEGLTKRLCLSGCARWMGRDRGLSGRVQDPRHRRGWHSLDQGEERVPLFDDMDDLFARMGVLDQRRFRADVDA